MYRSFIRTPNKSVLGRSFRKLNKRTLHCSFRDFRVLIIGRMSGNVCILCNIQGGKEKKTTPEKWLQFLKYCEFFKDLSTLTVCHKGVKKGIP